MSALAVQPCCAFLHYLTAFAQQAAFAAEEGTPSGAQERAAQSAASTSGAEEKKSGAESKADPAEAASGSNASEPAKQADATLAVGAEEKEEATGPVPAAGAAEGKDATGPAAAAEKKVPKPAAKPAEQPKYSLTFVKADVDKVLDFFSRILELTIVRDPTFKQPITIISSTKLTSEEALKVLQFMVEVSGYTFKKEGRVVQISKKPEEKAVAKPPEPSRPAEAPKPGEPGKPGEPPKAPEKKEEEKAVYEVVPLKNATAAQVAAEIAQVFGAEIATPYERIAAGAAPARRPTTGAPQPSGPEGAAKPAAKPPEVLRIVPETRLNALILRGPKDDVEGAKKLIAELDKPTERSSAIYKLEYARASDVAGILNQLFTGVGPSRPMTQPRRRLGEQLQRGRGAMFDYFPFYFFGGYPYGGPGAAATPTTMFLGASVVADERSNSLLITAAPNDLTIILDVVKQLDVRVPQVLIEAMIVEVVLTKDTEFGVEWKWAATRGSTGIDTSTFFDIDRTGAKGFRFKLLRGGLEAFMNALRQTSRVRVLSTPNITAQDNEYATINLGQRVPYVAYNYASTFGTTRGFGYQDVGITLDILPRIGPTGGVQLYLLQTSNEARATPGMPEQPTIITREAETTVDINDGETMVIGGLMRTSRSKEESKVPVLGELPLIGGLFRRSTSKSEQTELMMFLTPYIIRTPEQALVLTRERGERVEAPLKESGEHEQKAPEPVPIGPRAR